MDLAQVQGFCDWEATVSETWQQLAVPTIGVIGSPVLTPVWEPSFSVTADGQGERKCDFTNNLFEGERRKANEHLMCVMCLLKAFPIFLHLVLSESPRGAGMIISPFHR